MTVWIEKIRQDSKQTFMEKLKHINKQSNENGIQSLFFIHIKTSIRPQMNRHWKYPENELNANRQRDKQREKIWKKKIPSS